jgi:hypothetical protein
MRAGLCATGIQSASCITRDTSLKGLLMMTANRQCPSALMAHAAGAAAGSDNTTRWSQKKRRCEVVIRCAVGHQCKL